MRALCLALLLVASPALAAEQEQTARSSARVIEVSPDQTTPSKCESGFEVMNGDRRGSCVGQVRG